MQAVQAVGGVAFEPFPHDAPLYLELPRDLCDRNPVGELQHHPRALDQPMGRRGRANELFERPAFGGSEHNLERRGTTTHGPVLPHRSPGSSRDGARVGMVTNLRGAVLSLVWHPRYDGDAGHRFVREVFTRAARETAGDRHPGARTRLEVTPRKRAKKKRPVR